MSTNPMNALRGLAVLLLCQSAGEVIARLTGAPLPGPVLGMVLLAVLLRFESVRTPAAVAADGLLAHLSLLFVPVGVGVITHLQLVATYGVRMLLVIVFATWVGLAASALVLRALLPAGTDEATVDA